MLPVSDCVSELSSLSCKRRLTPCCQVALDAVDSNGKDNSAKLPVPGKAALLPPPVCLLCDSALCGGLSHPTFVLEAGVRGSDLGWLVRKETKSLQSNDRKDPWEAPW